MSEITDLGSPDRELSARDINRKTNKLNKINKKLKNTPAGTKRRHNLEFKKEKTVDQITTGKSGIRPVKKPFKVSHHYDLRQEKKFNEGISRKKSALNMIGIGNIKKGVKNVVDSAIDTHWKAEEKAYGDNTSELNDAYAVYDRGRRTQFGPGMGQGNEGPKGAFEFDTPKLRTKHGSENPGDDTTYSYMGWKQNRNK